MRKYLFAAAMVTAMAAPAFADEVGVHVGPVGAGVTVGEHRDHDRTTVIKERAPERDRTVIIRKDREPDVDRKVIIDHD